MGVYVPWHIVIHHYFAMTKIGWIVAVILALLVAGAGAAAYFTMNNQAAPVAETPTEESVEENTAPSQDATASVEVTAGAQTTTTVTYTDAGFSPAKVFIQNGNAVQFVNNSTRTMWVGVDDHPGHTKYDGTSTKEHCASGKNLNGSFDQCVASAPGTTYTFTFTKSGTFGYHNHTASKDVGSVVVE